MAGQSGASIEASGIVQEVERQGATVVLSLSSPRRDKVLDDMAAKVPSTVLPVDRVLIMDAEHCVAAAIDISDPVAVDSCDSPVLLAACHIGDRPGSVSWKHRAGSHSLDRT